MHRKQIQNQHRQAMKTTATLEKTSRQWWFYLLIISAQFIIMPLATRNFDFQQIQSIITTSLTKALIFKLTALYPYFQVTSLLFIGALFLLKNRFGRIFSLYAALSYLAFSIIQNIAVTETYGFSIVTINVLMFAGVAFTWLRESLYPQTDYSFRNLNWKTYWMIPLALFAFWTPLDMKTLEFSFTGSAFLTNGSALTFCMMTPVFLTIQTLCMPRVNRVTYRITAFVGILLGIYNLFNFLNPYTVNLGIVHIPLLLIALFSFIYSFTCKTSNTK